MLLVTQKAVKEALSSHGPMATCVDLAHHNSVAGRDEWRNVRSLIVVGRTQPAPASVERMAEALTGRAVEPLKGWYQRGDGVRHASGETMAIEADRHPDPICEAIRWQVCEGELMQIIGRGRGVNRTETDPLDVLVMSDAPLPIPVAQTLQAVDLAPNPADLMLAAGGVVFENAADAAATYPQLWSTRNAAKFALHRWRTEMAGQAADGIRSLIVDIIRGLIPSGPLVARVDYQRAGARMSPSVAWFDPALVPDVAGWLAERLSCQLAWCRAEGGPSELPPNAPRAERPKEPRPPPETAEPEPVWPDEPPTWADDDLGWSPNAFTPEMADLERWSASDVDARNLEDIAVTEMRFTDRDESLLEPGRLYPLMPRSLSLVEPHDMLVRLPPVREPRQEGQPPPIGRLIPAWVWAGQPP